MINGYRILREIGSGASGTVVAAVDEASGRPVAIRFLAPGLMADAGFANAFPGEAALLRSLSSPHLAGLLAYVRSPDTAAIVTELIEGVSLRTLLVERGPTGATAALAVLKDSLLGLAAAHRVGIVHRAYRPSNVLVTAEGPMVLTDVGIAARGFGPSGNASYTAPELSRGAPWGPAADLYAAAAVFFECLTGHAPSPDGGTAAVSVAEVPEPLRELAARGLAPSPADRPASAEAFAAELEDAASRGYGTTWEPAGLASLAAGAAHTASLSPRAIQDTGFAPSRTIPDTDFATATVVDATVPKILGAGVGASGAGAARRWNALRGVRGRAPLAIAGAVAAVIVTAAGGTVAIRSYSAAAQHPAPRTTAAVASGNTTVAAPSSTGPTSAPSSTGPSSASSAASGPTIAAGGAGGDPVAGPGHDCGPAGGKPFGRPADLVITTGDIRCSEALKVEQTYLSPETRKEVSGGFATFGGWTCGHSSVAGIEAGDAVSGCNRTDNSAGFAIKFASGRPPSSGSASGSSSGSGSTDPASVVRAYIAAINAHDYRRAWNLGGKNIGESYSAYSSGYAATSHDTLSDLSVHGDTVTAGLTTLQTDGTSRAFHGTYTVTNGVITDFNIRRTS
jgi:serine/threonine-protein kinase